MQAFAQLRWITYRSLFAQHWDVATKTISAMHLLWEKKPPPPFFLLPPFKKVGMLYQILRWLGRLGVSCGWRWDVSCQQRAHAESALPGPMAGRPWAMAELRRQALCWHGTSRRHLQETDEPYQAFLIFLNGGSIKHSVDYCSLKLPSKTGSFNDDKS